MKPNHETPKPRTDQKQRRDDTILQKNKRLRHLTKEVWTRKSMQNTKSTTKTPKLAHKPQTY